MKAKPILFTAALVMAAMTAHAEVVSVNVGQSLRAIEGGTQKKLKLAPGITSSKSLPNASLVKARKAMVGRRRVALRKIRALADVGDGYAAYLYAQRLEAKDRPALAADIAHYYGIAAATGRPYAMTGMIRAIDQIDPAETSQGRLSSLKKVLTAYVHAGNPAAVEAALRYHFASQPFGDLSQEIDVVVGKKDAVSAGPISLQLASKTLQRSDASTQDLEKAQGYLLTASASPSLSIRVTAENLLPVVQARLDQHAALGAALQQEKP